MNRKLSLNELADKVMDELESRESDDLDAAYAESDRFHAEQEAREKSRLAKLPGAVLCNDCGWPHVPADEDDSCACHAEPNEYRGER